MILNLVLIIIAFIFPFAFIAVAIIIISKNTKDTKRIKDNYPPRRFRYINFYQKRIINMDSSLELLLIADAETNQKYFINFSDCSNIYYKYLFGTRYMYRKSSNQKTSISPGDQGTYWIEQEDKKNMQYIIGAKDDEGNSIPDDAIFIKGRAEFDKQ